jgi:hypothetical protein
MKVALLVVFAEQTTVCFTSLKILRKYIYHPVLVTCACHEHIYTLYTVKKRWLLCSFWHSSVLMAAAVFMCDFLEMSKLQT